MEWRDEAIILGVRHHGETSAIVEVMSCHHGRHLGLVKGARGRRFQPLLQLGNRVELHWWARLDEHLGSFRIEARDFVAARLMQNPLALYAMQTLCAHLRLLPERDPHPALYARLNLLLDHGQTPLPGAEIVARFELCLLTELGFGLDLSRCAATGSVEDLAFVSPKSARAVSRAAGLPWKDKMLPLPTFLCQTDLPPADFAAIAQALHLTGFFLTRHVWEPRAIQAPMMREQYQNALQRLFDRTCGQIPAPSCQLSASDILP